MKKLFISAIAILAFSSVSFASDYDFMNKLNNEQTFKGLSRYIKADYDQRNALKYIFNETEKKKDVVEKQIAEGKASSKDLEKVLYFNLANVKAVLSDRQYRDYLVVLNMTQNNKMAALLTEK
jgi:septal ring factor EnvC (AmiA/AmiB activator)